MRFHYAALAALAGSSVRRSAFVGNGRNGYFILAPRLTAIQRAEQFPELKDYPYARSVLDVLPIELRLLTELPRGQMLIYCALWCQNQSPENAPFAFDENLRSQREPLLGLCKRGGEESLFHWMWSRSISNVLTPQELPRARFASVIELGKGVEYLLSYFCLASNTESIAGFAFQSVEASSGLEHATLQDPETLNWEGLSHFR